MIPLVEENRSQLVDLCRKHYVGRLDLFGSATRAGAFNVKDSDLDFLVEFLPTAAMNPADQYFGLLYALELLFGRKVDLVTVRSLRNPYFIKSVEATREPLYAA